MECANTRKQFNQFISNHLIASALQALRNKTQSAVARTLGVHDSTILRRTEKYPEICETLVASGIIDFVMEGERKISEEEYRFLWKQMGELSQMKIKKTPRLRQQTRRVVQWNSPFNVQIHCINIQFLSQGELRFPFLIQLWNGEIIP
ncbi:transposase family protein [Proteus mirabilis]